MRTTVAIGAAIVLVKTMSAMNEPDSLENPSLEFSLLPFWFWNDELREAELLRQIDDFRAHGVHGFVIHPRVGLPRSIGFMSPEMGRFVRAAVEAAAVRGMRVILYDDGMYPSGSAGGLVVERNPDHGCRCVARVPLDHGESAPSLPAGQHLVATLTGDDGRRWAVVDRPANSVIRGLHYVGEGPEEELPPAADILNPDAVRSFIRIVYDGYFQWVGEHFGRTVTGIFTDEPSLLGRRHEAGAMPGTTGIMDHVNRLLGYDFRPRLLSLWDETEPGAHIHRKRYLQAVERRLEETYYAPIHDWCAAHKLELMGHPMSPSAIRLERHLDVPGQDLVWRQVLPQEANGIEGAESTQAKCTSSAMIHLRRRRNSNECFGAYGHGFTWVEMKSLADWCFVRGVNMLIPHAFYYSVRGPRRDERPPDVGPHSQWWDRYGSFADYCRRLCWLNTDCRHVCNVAILAEADSLPWRAARLCFENQCDFNYLDVRHLAEDAIVDDRGVHIAGMHYTVLVVEGSPLLSTAAETAVGALEMCGRVVRFGSESDAPEFVRRLGRIATKDLSVVPAQPALRYRHVEKRGVHYYLLANESKFEINFRPDFAVAGQTRLTDIFRERQVEWRRGDPLTLRPAELLVVEIQPELP